MKTKLLLTLWYSIFIIGICFAQEESTSRTYAVKNYFSISVEPDDINFIFENETYSLRDSMQVFDYRLFRPAFNIFDKFGNLHEIEILKFQFTNDEKSVLTQSFNPDSTTTTLVHDIDEEIRRIYLRYSYSFSILQKNKFIFYLGGSIQPYYDMLKRPALPEIFGYSESELKSVGVHFHLVPRLNFSITEKLFIDVNVLLPMLKIENTKFIQTVDDVENTYEYDINQKLKGIWELAVGIGYKF